MQLRADGIQIFHGDFPPDALLADLHVHTRRSDGWWQPERLAEAAVARGLSAIAVTDHDDCSAGFVVADYCARRGLPLRVYPGSEITAREHGHDVHVIGLDLQSDVRPWQSLAATVEEVMRQGGIVIMPHPKPDGFGFPSFSQILQLDVPVAIEVFNAAAWDLAWVTRLRGLADANRAARAFYETHRYRFLGAVGGTDAHFRTVGRGLTLYHGDLRQALLRGETAVAYRPERERLTPWDPMGYVVGLRRLDARRKARYG
ncbi:MAG: phosphotransferase [Thermomicrobiales bacterium]|nr:MAG: phosphotransferase [Thermomicrobiales bacterium]